MDTVVCGISTVLQFSVQSDMSQYYVLVLILYSICSVFAVLLCCLCLQTVTQLLLRTVKMWRIQMEFHMWISVSWLCSQVSEVVEHVRNYRNQEPRSTGNNCESSSVCQTGLQGILELPQYFCPFFAVQKRWHVQYSVMQFFYSFLYWVLPVRTTTLQYLPLDSDAASAGIWRPVKSESCWTQISDGLLFLIPLCCCSHCLFLLISQYLRRVCSIRSMFAVPLCTCKVFSSVEKRAETLGEQRSRAQWGGGGTFSSWKLRCRHSRTTTPTIRPGPGTLDPPPSPNPALTFEGVRPRPR